MERTCSFQVSIFLQQSKVMKTIIIQTLLFCTCVLLLLPEASRAQSILINSVSATSFCAGDSLTVHFTASGNWGDNNSFILQLSDINGSFMNGTFTKLGTAHDAASGVYSISSQIWVASSQRYR